jgi:hypothetical protein
MWRRLTHNFVFRDDYELSLLSRGNHFGLNPELGIFTGSITWNFGGIDDQGELIIAEQEDGTLMTALDKYNEAFNWMLTSYPDVIAVHTAQLWVEACIAMFGNLKEATVGSGKNGSTFTNEGSHWNDTGCKIVARGLTPLFDFDD